MRFCIISFITTVLATALPNPGFVKDVAEETFPTLDRAVYAAANESMKAVTELITNDTNEYIKRVLHDIPLMPNSLENMCSRVLNRYIVQNIGKVVAESIERDMPKTIKSVMSLLKSEIYRVDRGVDLLMKDFRNNMRSKGRLPAIRG